MESLNDDVLLEILKYLDPDSFWNVLQTSNRFIKVSNGSTKLLKNIILNIDPEKYALLKQGGELSEVQFRNLSITNFKKRPNELRSFLQIIKSFKNSVEILELVDFKERSVKFIISFFASLPSLTKIKLRDCFIQEEVDREILNPWKNLRELHFEKCDENFFEIFRFQKSVTKITIQNNDYTWHGFPYDAFNDLVKTLPNFRHLELIGIGTGNYFSCDNFPFKLEKLETNCITFHWYVGMRQGRIKFLSQQLGNLKELKIHQLPFDFDGGKVLKYILEQMKLDKFYLGKIPLILNGQKQQVREFSACETQICSIYEMFHQFPSIQKVKLTLSAAEIDSSAIERIINPRTELFNNAKSLEVLDNSGCKCILGLFLGLLKNFRFIEKLKIQSPDRNINVLLQEFIPLMTNLKEIYIDSEAPRINIRLTTIRNSAAGLRKLHVPSQFVDDTLTFFSNQIEVFATEIYNYNT